VFPFNGVPEVRLTTVSPDGTGTQRVAFDAVALVPLTSRTVKTLSWNLAGAAMNDGDYYVVDRLMTEVRARQPDVLLLNEVCDGQFDNLGAKLAQAGWAMSGNFQITGSGANPTCFNADGGDLTEGIAVFVRGTVVSTQNYRFRHPDHRLVTTPSTEPLGTRGVACTTVRFSDTTVDSKVCVTHLETGYPSNMSAGYQAQELGRVFGPEARQRPFILGGDTNIDTLPESEHIGALYAAPLGTGEFNEVEQARACVTAQPCEVYQGGSDTFLGGGPDAEQKKLDYVFADRWHFAVPIGRVVVNDDVGLCGEQRDAPCSDHKLLYSELLLARG
jgi:endonuclease/exonuclease/phosphatase family metal-dependent hydrolase